MAGSQNASPVRRYYSALFDPFSEHDIATKPTSDIVGIDHLHPGTSQIHLHSPALSLDPIARPIALEEEPDAVLTGPSASKTDPFVFLPGNAARKRLYHCSWSGCTKSYGALNHLNAHIIMQRHGSKRTPAGEIRAILHD